ncbi:UDP-glycosyltransferase UGT5-like [Schistocerca cancellata]|uniref:UDP-glycosyltransferase UGT5-like n=1 Tax=Schistocerca cancellata TaxID=274614 RepID=UPI00211731B1|nr:UDP-glycosyltransferase UGT5-like [Schistocerca cancellata]
MGASRREQMVAIALLLLLSLLEATRAAHVLVVFPLGSPSHWNLGRAIAKGLHAQGHRITAVTPFPGQGPPNNWTDVALPNTMSFFGHTAGLFDLGTASDFAVLLKMQKFGTYSCEIFLQHENVKKLFSSNEKYDVMIIEIFFCECFLALSHIFKIPVIQFATFSPPAWMGDVVGNPSPPAYVPEPFLEYSDHMTFFQRLHNTVFSTYCRVVRNLYYMPSQDVILRRYVDDPTLPSLLEMERKSSMVLANSHFSVLHPRPLLPAMVEVGGMHVSPPKKLPEDLQKFLDGAKDGAVVFSLGSNLRSADLGEDKRTAILTAFSKLKQRVIWKWETETLPGKPENLMVKKWLPQADILAHKNLKVFITHGGLLSTFEAVYHGVPVVGVPVFGDQELNMIRAEEKGYALRLQFNNLTAESFFWAITEVLHNPSYRMKAQQLSRLFHDRPRTPLQEVVYWTEYVVRHKGAPHMRSAALELCWYQRLLLDVLAAALAAAAALLWVLKVALRTVHRLIVGRGPDSPKKKLKKK